jgi:hypothetical protein
MIGRSGDEVVGGRRRGKIEGMLLLGRRRVQAMKERID